MTNLTFAQISDWQTTFAADSDLYTLIYDGSQIVSNGSVAIMYCNSMVNSSSSYWNATWQQYRKQSNPGGVLLLSFVQNLLSSIVSITNIYISLTNNLNTNNDYQVQYDIGRLLHVFMFFPMYEQKDDPYYIDETTVALIELSPSQQ